MGSRRYRDGQWFDTDPGDPCADVPADVAALVSWVQGDLHRAQLAWEAELRRPATRPELERLVRAVEGVMA